MASEDKKIESKRDEELDVARATEIARDYLRSIIGNLLASQFRLEEVKKNGKETRYIIICSIVPDIGEKRDYYLIRVDVETKKLVPPIGKGKLEDGKVKLNEIEIDSKYG